MKPRSLLSEIGIGATEELSLRVSVAALVRVLFEDPQAGDLMLALERRATLHGAEPGHTVDIKSQPFGGALRIHDLAPLQNRIREFHFDSEESRSEQDFRIFIQPSAWGAVREFCLEHLNQPNHPVLESNPTRELTEEFADTLAMTLKPDQYIYQPMGTVVESNPSPTENINGRGYPTARIYRIFEARILDSSLAWAMISNSETCSDQELYELALEDSRNGGSGRANAVITLPFQEITASYLTVPLELRDKPIWFHGHQLDETVAAVLVDVSVPKYRRIS